MPINHFHKCSQAATDAELIALSKSVGYALPDAFLVHYRNNNGGIPERAWWDSLDENPPCKVREFCSVAHGKHTIESVISKLNTKKRLPKGFMPFAFATETDTFFCLNLINESVFLISPSPEPSDEDDDEAEVPRTGATKRCLARNFNEFVKGLVSENELD